MYIIELQGISKRYGENEVLRDVNLTVEEGEVLGIIGPTGSGKSTLLRIIDLLERPSEGMILFRGSPVTSTVDARRMMGMVFQNSPVFRGTVLDNVLYGPSVRGLKPAGVRLMTSLNWWASADTMIGMQMNFQAVRGRGSPLPRPS